MAEPEVSPRFAWRSVSKIASDTERVVDAAESIADLLPLLLEAIDTDEAAATPLAARVASASELADAAARMRHVALRLQVAAADLVMCADVHLADAERTPRTWLARHGGLSHGAASELCRVAETCARFPAVGRSFHAGELTVGHVDAISRIIPSRFRGAALDEAVNKILDVQDVIVGTARATTVAEFTDFCGRVRDRLDADGSPDRAREGSRVWLRRLFDGRWDLRGDLSPDDGAILSTILQDRRASRIAAEKATETASESVTAESAEDPSSPDPASPAPDHAERQARDLLDLVIGGAADHRPGRIGLFLHIDHADLEAPGQSSDDGFADLLAGRRPAHTEAGLDITDNTLWRLMADAEVTPVFNRAGHSLSYGRSRRLVPPMLRRILAHRDRRCRFPGCDRPPIWCDGHHIDHWEDGGETTPSNCCGECSYHHHAHHDRRFGIDGDADGELRHTRPDGSPLDIEPRYLRPRPARAESPDVPPGNQQIAS